MELLAAIPGVMAGRRHPGTQTFIDAWEMRFGEMRLGVSQTYPPLGLFQEWERESQVTREPPGEWLDRKIRELSGGARDYGLRTDRAMDAR